MAKNDVTPVTTRLTATMMRRAVDYGSKRSLSAEDQQKALAKFEATRAFTEATSQLRKQTKTAGLLPRWRESTELDKAVSASLALWYIIPGEPYRVTINFDHKYKDRDFGSLRDELTRTLKKHQIVHHYFSFEVSDSSRLHCHGLVNIHKDIDTEALCQALQRRFAISREIKHSLRGRNKIVHIDRVIYAPHEGKGPEYWASYSIGDAKLTTARMGWKSPYYLSRALLQPTKRIYDWLRNPDIAQLPFDPEDTLPVKKPDWLQQSD